MDVRKFFVKKFLLSVIQESSHSRGTVKNIEEFFFNRSILIHSLPNEKVSIHYPCFTPKNFVTSIELSLDSTNHFR